MNRLVAFSCGGLGVYLGYKYQQQCAPSKIINNDADAKLLPYIIPSVCASTSVIPQPPSSAATVPSSEIMKYGYPSLENIRTYDGFVIAYDKRNRTPYWVFEKLDKARVHRNNNINRENCRFHEDESIHEYHRATNKDYKNSGYDRGHLAAAGNHRISQNAIEQTFTLSNISPQVGEGFNRHAWNTLEKYVRYLARKYKQLYVCTGPLYLPRKEEDGKLYVKYEVIGANHVAVPTHFFKVVLCETENADFELYSYIMPNQKLPQEINLQHYLFPLETIERASGLIIFNKLQKNRLRRINGHKPR